jgi:hypothetical protein
MSVIPANPPSPHPTTTAPEHLKWTNPLPACAAEPKVFDAVSKIVSDAHFALNPRDNEQTSAFNRNLRFRYNGAMFQNRLAHGWLIPPA